MRVYGWMAGVGLLCASAAQAQMAVHAVSGVVKSVDARQGQVQVVVSDDTPSVFKLVQGKEPVVDFDSALKADTTSPGSFQKVGDYAVVYFYGFNDDQTAVAMRDLGPGPFTKAEVTVTGYDKHDRTLTAKDSTGKTVSVKLDDHLVVDGDMNVDSGRKYAPHKGDVVRVTYASANGANDAVFLKTLR